jgi:NAD(P)H dehydrogenase (quinone)
MEARLAARLAGQASVIAGWDARPRIAFNADGDFDAAGRLRDGAPSYHPFIRR